MKAYRYTDRSGTHLSIDIFGDVTPIPGRTELILEEYEVLSHTPKGYWVGLGEGFRWKRFVLADATKKFAHLTKAKAKESFIARKKKQVRILERQLRHAKDALGLIEKEDIAE